MNKLFRLVLIGLVFAIANINANIYAQSKGTFKDSRDGKTYKTVKIGTQTWMAENLAYKASNGIWAYDNNQSNVAKYGYLYNWETAKKVCPSGWHLPSDAEWTKLTDYLGGESVAGGKLKSTIGFKSPNTGATNSSGFSALPAGHYDSYDKGNFFYIGQETRLWTSTPDNGSTSIRVLSHNESKVSRSIDNRTYDLSVRCLLD